MNEEALAVIFDLIRAQPWPFYDSEVPLTAGGEVASSLPYTLAVPPAGSPTYERSLDGSRSDREGRLLIKAVGASSVASRGVLERTRAVLTGPGFTPLRLVGPTWVATLSWEGTPQSSVVDRDVTLMSTNSHPVFSTDEYELTVSPR